MLSSKNTANKHYPTTIIDNSYYATSCRGEYKERYK